MKTFKVTVYWSIIFLLTTSSSSAQGTTPREVPKSCRAFVQGFYDWYLPKIPKESDGPSWDLAVKNKSTAFSPALVEALREDLEAQAKVAGEIVGLDFDPFLNSQDPGERYVVGNVTQKGDSCWAEVYGIWSGKRSAKPEVVSESVLKDGLWHFVNFHYGKSNGSGDVNLVTMLKNLRKDRQTPPK